MADAWDDDTAAGADAPVANDWEEKAEIVDDDAGAPEEDQEESEEDTDYPITVEYCPVCSLPYEYCENGPCADKCKEKLAEDDPALFKRYYGTDSVHSKGDGEIEQKKRQKRGGKALAGKAAKTKASESTGNAKKSSVSITLITRNKRKFVTNISGLGALGINLKKASKTFAGRFAASSSVTGDDEIGVTGDHTSDIADVILDKFPEVTQDMICFPKK